MRTFKPSEKLEAVLTAYSLGRRPVNPTDMKRNGLAARAVCRAYGISPTLLKSWVVKLDQAAELIFERKNSKANNLLNELKAENKILRRKIRAIKQVVNTDG